MRVSGNSSSDIFEIHEIVGTSYDIDKRQYAFSEALSRKSDRERKRFQGRDEQLSYLCIQDPVTWRSQDPYQNSSHGVHKEI